MKMLTRFRTNENLGSISRRNYYFTDVAFILFFSSLPVRSLLMRISSTYGPTIYLSLFAIVYFFAIIQKKQRGERQDVFLFFVIGLSVACIIGVTYLLKPEIRSWILNSNWGVFKRILTLDSGIYALFVLLLVKNPKRIISNFRIPVILNFIYEFLQLLQAHVEGGWLVTAADGVTMNLTDYSMSFGYAMITVAIFSFAVYFVFKQKIYFYVATISSLLAVLYGSRGALLSIGIFALLIVAAYKKDRAFVFVIGFSAVNSMLFLLVRNYIPNIAVILILTWSLLSVLVVVYFRESKTNYAAVVLIVNVVLFSGIILMLFSNVLDDFVQTDSRTLTALLSGSLLEDNGRNTIWGMASEQIKNNFPLGNGFFGDRPIIGTRFAWGYSHNFILEMLVSFGILGVVFIFYMLYSSIQALIYTKFNYEGRILLLIFTALFSKLLISDSFWYSVEFWGLMGTYIIINYSRSKETISLDSDDYKSLSTMRFREVSCSCGKR